MIKTNISFDKACDNVTHFHTPYKKGKLKGKTPLESNEFGFTCYANSVKVLEQYAKNEYTVPTKAKQAKELLSKI